MSLPWDDEQLLRLNTCWRRGDSTKAIANHFSHVYRQEVSKNAVVGKIHRLAALFPNGGWDARPSPIRRAPVIDLGALLSRAAPPPPLRPASTLPPLPSSLTASPPPFVDRPPTFLALASQPAPPPVSERSIVMVQPAAARRVQCSAAEPSEPKVIRRRDGTGCLFPIGDPGSQRFCYCDGDLYSLSKPYCDDHAKLSYVKRRGEQSMEHE